jgi:hypothetical protein
MNMDSDYVSRMMNGYVECALWSESGGIVWDDDSQRFVEDPDNDQSFLDHNFEPDDITSESLEKMLQDVTAFAMDNADDLAMWEPEQAGHDFWLTRNGHGAGFWDRGNGAAGDRLTEASKSYGQGRLWYDETEEVINFE